MLLAKYPPGLLAMLDMKSSGQAPRDFAEAVIGMIDVSQFYRVNQREGVSQDANVTNAGDLVSTLVPNGKTWLVEAMSVGVGMAIGDTQLCGKLFVSATQGGARVSVGSIRHVQAALAATANWNVEASCPSFPLLLPSGTQLGFVLEANLPGARTAALRILVTSFDV